MHDKKLILEILEQIYDSARTVLKRFEPIKSVNDFTDSETGMEKLDAICMQLIAIGEVLKNLDKITNNSLLPNILLFTIQALIPSLFTRLEESTECREAFSL